MLTMECTVVDNYQTEGFDRMPKCRQQFPGEAGEQCHCATCAGGCGSMADRRQYRVKHHKLK